MNRKINIKEIKKKNGVIDNAVKVLKKEFVGIDKQIDEIMDNVRTWYLYPQLQTRPLVVSIWGLSGTGKTSLIRRISQLLDIEKDFVYWNFASISESNSWEIENQIEEELANESSNRMFLYDEFQYAATISPSNHEERDNKSGLKPFWELLDTGVIHKRSDFWTVRIPYKVIDYMSKINVKHPMEIKDGVWVNARECLEYFPPYDIAKFREVFNFEYDERQLPSNVAQIEPRVPISERDWIDVESCDGVVPKQQKSFFINDYYLKKIIELHDMTTDGVNDRLEVYHKMEKMNTEELLDFICNVYENSRKGYDLRFHDSIIFVVGNLDEAYEMSFNVNPDMSPDQFRKITEKINVVDIKQALKERFRNEQIARLGNIHVIYPSFSEENFRQIIDLTLDSYEKEAYEVSGYHLLFDDTLKQIIYEEGVFPTHGTRPIFSTIHEIVKSKLPETIRFICEQGVKDTVANIKYSFDNATDIEIAECYDKNDNLLCSTTFKLKLRLKSLRDSDESDEEQALCALHESGHFVMYAKLFGKMPEKLVSRTADSDTGGFLMEDIEESKKKFSKKDMLNELKVLLGGYVAEKMFFGDEMSAGASHDLSVATQLVSKMVRRFGMGMENYVTTYVKGGMGDPNGLLVNEENQTNINRQIKEIMAFAENEVRLTFVDEEWKKMLKESALYLCENSAMPLRKMQELYDKVSPQVKVVTRSDTFYHDAILNM